MVRGSASVNATAGAVKCSRYCRFVTELLPVCLFEFYLHVLFPSAVVISVCSPGLPCHAMSNFNSPHVTKQWTVKKEKKNGTSWFWPVAQCSAENCASFVTETHIVEDRKKVSVLILLSCSFQYFTPDLRFCGMKFMVFESEWGLILSTSMNLL